MARPAANTVAGGTYYLATDDTSGGPQGTLYQSNGTNWNFPNQVAYSQGTIGSRPAPLNPGRVYLATDKSNQVSFDTGSSWIPMGLAERAISSTATAAAGETIGTAVGGITVNLPSANPAGQTIAVYSGPSVTASSPTTVASGSANIYGLGLSAASSFLLGTPLAAVVLFSDGGNWIVISGQQDTGWVPMTLGVNITDLSSGSRVPAARKLGDRLYFRGAITNNTGSLINFIYTVATIPAVCRPNSVVDIVLSTVDLAAQAVYMRIDAGAGGVLRFCGSNTGWAHTSSIALDPLSSPLT